MKEECGEAPNAPSLKTRENKDEPYKTGCVFGIIGIQKLKRFYEL
jgi:hypothetical protein